MSVMNFGNYFSRRAEEPVTIDVKEIKSDLEDLRQIFLKNTDKPNVNDPLTKYRAYLFSNRWTPNFLLVSAYFNEYLNSPTDIYLFSESKFFFPFINFDIDWNEIVKLAKITGKFKDHKKFMSFMQHSQLQKFNQALRSLFKAYNNFIFNRPDSFLELIQKNEWLIEGIPDAVYTFLLGVKRIMLPIKNEILREYPSPLVMENFDNWDKLCNLLNISDQVDEKVIKGLKYLIVINTNEFFADIIIDLLNEPNDKILLSDVFKTFFEFDQNDYTLSTKKILLQFMTKNNEDSYFFQEFKKFLLDPRYKDVIPKFFFEDNNFILKLLNAERVIPNLMKPFSGPVNEELFKNNQQINKDIIPVFMAQENFKIVFFDVITKTLLLVDPERQRPSYREYVTLSRQYLLKQIDQFIKEYPMKITFEYYAYLKDKIPTVEGLKHLITKESILEFLNKEDPDPDIIEAWREMNRLQDPNINLAQIPPVPEWFIRQYDASNVHNKSVIKITDCRLKLLKENNKDVKLTIDDIAGC